MNDWLIVILSLTSFAIIYWAIWGENKNKEMFK